MTDEVVAFVGLGLVLIIVVLWKESAGPPKQGRQACWYCRAHHEHWTYRGAWLCDFFSGRMFTND